MSVRACSMLPWKVLCPRVFRSMSLVVHDIDLLCRRAAPGKCRGAALLLFRRSCSVGMGNLTFIQGPRRFDSDLRHNIFRSTVSQLSWQSARLKPEVSKVRILQKPRWPRALLVEHSDCRSERRGFDSRRGRDAPVAQLVELRTFNPKVVGSSPTGRTTVDASAFRHALTSAGAYRPASHRACDRRPREPFRRRPRCRGRT